MFEWQAKFLLFSLKDLFSLSAANMLLFFFILVVACLLLLWYNLVKFKKARLLCEFLAEHAEEAFIFTNGNLKIDHASQKIFQFFPGAPQIVPGMNLADICGESMAKQMAEAAGEGKKVLLGIAGSLILNIKIFKLKETQTGSGYLFLLVDETQKIKLESELVSQIELFKKLTETISEGYVLHAENGTILECNKKACEILGLTEAQLLGRDSLDPRWHSITTEGKPYPGAMHPAMRTLNTKKALTGEIMGIQIPDNGTRWIEINTRYVSEPTAGAARVMVTFTDITWKFSK